MLNKEKKVQPTSKSGNDAKPFVSGSLPSTEYCIEKARAMIKVFREVDAKMFPTMAIRAETLEDFINDVMSVRQ